MIYFKIGFINIDFSSLLALVIGIGIGIALTLMVYATLVLISLKPKKYVVKAEAMVSDEEIKEIIDNAYNSFNDRTLQGDKPTFIHCKDVCVNITKDIARKFFPNSNHPALELTVDEALRLITYLSGRLDELLSKPAIKLVRSMRIAKIVSMTEVKKKIDDSELMQMTKKYKVKKVWSAVRGALNVVNPVYWTKKLVIKSSLEIVTRKLCVAIIGLVGEEVYKIYSKNVFDEDVEIDSGALKLISEANEELEQYSPEEIEEYVENEDAIIEDYLKSKEEE